jgi:hypothetical protein
MGPIRTGGAAPHPTQFHHFPSTHTRCTHTPHTLIRSRIRIHIQTRTHIRTQTRSPPHTRTHTLHPPHPHLVSSQMDCCVAHHRVCAPLAPSVARCRFLQDAHTQFMCVRNGLSGMKRSLNKNQGGWEEGEIQLVKHSELGSSCMSLHLYGRGEFYSCSEMKGSWLCICFYRVDLHPTSFHNSFTNQPSLSMGRLTSSGDNATRPNQDRILVSVEPVEPVEPVVSIEPSRESTEALSKSEALAPTSEE